MADTKYVPGAHDLYERDLILWLRTQIDALRDGDTDALDRIGLVEELEGLVSRDKRRLHEHVRAIIEYRLRTEAGLTNLLPLRYVDPIDEEQLMASVILQCSPSLRDTFPETIADAYSGLRRYLFVCAKHRDRDDDEWDHLCERLTEDRHFSPEDILGHWWDRDR